MTLAAGSRSCPQNAEEILPAGSVTFVLCVEANRLERQALLLCESIREFGGRYAKSSIVAVSPRPGLALGLEARSHLRDLDVTYVAEPLNTTGHPYGTINRIVVGAWAEDCLTSSHLVVLDTDTILIGEPVLMSCDVGVRPVDMKGSASGGASDGFDAYWARVCSIAGVTLDTLPWLWTTVSRQQIRASYNGGFSVVRRSTGVLRHTRDVFFQSILEDLRPHSGTGINVYASTGFVGTEASEWWGSSQAALSAAIWSKTKDVKVYGPEYNIPVHLVANEDCEWSMPEHCAPLLLHYHYLSEPEHHHAFNVGLAKLGCPYRTKEWIFDRLDRG